MTWKLPPRIKVYEALGAITDSRIHIKGNTAIVISSSGHKQYTVTYDPKTHAITANDNSSYWQGYIGYPAIAYLLKKGLLSYNKKTTQCLKDIPWKDINTKFRNNFRKTEEYVEHLMKEKYPTDLNNIEQEVKRIATQLKKLKLQKLPSRLKPPVGY